MRPPTPSSVGILAPVAEAIAAAHGDRAEVYVLPYMARVFDNGHTYADSTLESLTEATAVLSPRYRGRFQRPVWPLRR